MRKAAITLLVLAAICFAGQRKVVKKIVKADTVVTIKADTVVTIKLDTIKTVRHDTLLVRQLVQDSSWVVKADTVKAPDTKKPPKKDAPKKAPPKATKKDTKRK